MRPPVPEGYVRVRQSRANAVVAAQCAPAVDSILAESSLYDWARTQADRREYAGRGAVYSADLPECNLRVVVRRARHGGLLGSLFREVFVVPTRAPRELAMSLFLRHLGIATPAIVGYVTYRVAPLLRRVDVLTAEVPNASDLAGFLAHTTAAGERHGAWRATARLLRRLTQTGVWHPDLNARNVLITAADESRGSGEDGLRTAVVLDIDRVRLMVPGDPQLAEANLERLLHSLRKLAAATPDAELAEFGALVRAPVVASAPGSTLYQSS